MARAAATPKRTILVVDDDESILEVLDARLSAGGYATLSARSAEKGLELLERASVDLVISDMRMPGMGGKGLLEKVATERPNLPVIMLTAYGTIPDAVASVKTGAVDYMTKPFEGEELLARVGSILNGSVRASAQPSARPAPGPAPVDRRLWGGKSQSMKRLFDLIEKVAPTDVTVLINGESGTGKEKVSRIIHERSHRASGPFVVVDCGSTPAGLLESELFGHVKGSFTHAVRDKRGLIEEASGGTLLLDEIGNISSEMQTRLLRFLQERTIRRIGDTKEISIDCRVLAATNADLQAMVKEGSFREDLYFRLKVIAMVVPPLRERKEDIPALTQRFVEAFSKANGMPTVTIIDEAMQILMDYSWPGNVRELKHVIEAGVVLSSGGIMQPEDLHLEPMDEPIAAAAQEAGTALSLDESEKRAILRALEQSNWVQKDAADVLGISRRAIHYKVKKYGIDVHRRR
ncbi:MAG: sigma-54 dependent transcriptional regulator [Desulfocurvibacter africanus]